MLLASLKGFPSSVEVAEVDFEIDVKLPESGMIFESIVGLLELRVIADFFLEKHMLNHLEGIFIVVLFE